MFTPMKSYRLHFSIAFFAIALLILVSTLIPAYEILLLLGLCVVSFIQNMAFTWTSRSRNSGDPEYHRYAAWGSNGIWFVGQLFMFGTAWKHFMDGDILFAVLVGIIYTLSTTEGSVFMMRLLTGKVQVPYGPLNKVIQERLVERGKRKVGA